MVKNIHAGKATEVPRQTAGELPAATWETEASAGAGGLKMAWKPETPRPSSLRYGIRDARKTAIGLGSRLDVRTMCGFRC